MKDPNHMLCKCGHLHWVDTAYLNALAANICPQFHLGSCYCASFKEANNLEWIEYTTNAQHKTS